jgi:hypothetical protein
MVASRLLIGFVGALPASVLGSSRSVSATAAYGCWRTLTPIVHPRPATVSALNAFALSAYAMEFT